MIRQVRPVIIPQEICSSRGDSLSPDQANFDGDFPYGGGAEGRYLRRPAAVGCYPQNPWGLYDTAGNVWEWVWNWYSADEYKLLASQVAVDPQGSAQGVSRALRGGGWIGYGRFRRPADRDRHEPGEGTVVTGFRLALGRLGE